METTNKEIKRVVERVLNKAWNSVKVELDKEDYVDAVEYMCHWILDKKQEVCSETGDYAETMSQLVTDEGTVIEAWKTLDQSEDSERVALVKSDGIVEWLVDEEHPARDSRMVADEIAAVLADMDMEEDSENVSRGLTINNKERIYGRKDLYETGRQREASS